MIIDSHTHVQRVPDSFWDSPPERLIALMDEAGVDKSVIMSYGGAPSEVAVDYIHQVAQQFSPRLIAYANLDPREGEKAVALLRHAVTELGFSGLKLHPVAYELHPSDPLSVAILKAAGELRVPALFHCGDEDYTLPLQLACAARLVPDTTMILGHMGGYFHVEDAIRVARECPNIILETSAMPYPAIIRKAVQAIGSKRVMYASDGPGCVPVLEVEKVRLAGLTEEEEEDLFWRNYMKLHTMRKGKSTNDN
ncbi:MAG: amidohydrolase family protein [Candidatus Xenobiia bacterium LiM19]